MNADNKFGECCKCPAKMSDGRIFTNHLSSSKTNCYIQKLNNIKNHTEYRHFLQKNAEKLINNENNFLQNNKKCNFSLTNESK